MSWIKLSRNLLRIAVLVALFAITPLTLAPTEGIQENRACATDQCVERIGEACYIEGKIIEDHTLVRTIY